jgi:hypothetical protein
MNKNVFVTEYELLVWYESNRSFLYLRDVYVHFGQMIGSSHAGYCDLEAIKSDFSADIDYLSTLKKYNTLRHQCNDKLRYDEKGFHLEGHTFETLKDVKKALKNKAFL